MSLTQFQADEIFNSGRAYKHTHTHTYTHTHTHTHTHTYAHPHTRSKSQTGLKMLLDKSLYY